MICGKCNSPVPEGYAFCPFCGQKVDSAVVEAPVVARSAMPKEEEYAGRYETGDMPEPEIRFSKNLQKKEQIPAQQPAPAEQIVSAPVEEAAPAEPAPAAPVEETVAEQKTCACGAPLREGAKFCNFCGKSVMDAPVVEEPAPVYVPPVMEEPAPVFVPPVVEEPAPVYVPPVMEEPAPVYVPPVMEEPAPVFVPPVVEEPAPVFVPPVVEEPAPVFVPSVVEEPAPVYAPPVAEEPAGAVCSCGMPLQEGAKFCNFCGKPVEAVIRPEPSVPAGIRCAACGAKLEEGAKFCNVCGQRLVTEEPQISAQQPVPPTQQPAAQQIPSVKKCPLCGTVVPADATSCTGCGVGFRVHTQASQSAAAPATPRKKAPKAAKRSKTPLIIGIIAVIAVIGVVAAGFLLGWFGSSKPLTAIYDATEKTLCSGGFNMEFDISVPETGKFSGKADCVLDIDKKELTLLAELTMDGESVKLAVLDGVAAVQMPGQEAFSMQIDGVLDMVFEALDEGMSFEEALEQGVEAALEAAGMKETIDSDKAFDCVQDTINSVSWMKENAGYSTRSEGGVQMHVLEPKLGDLVIAAIEAMEPSFEDADEAEEGLEYMKENKSQLNEMADVELAFGIKGGKLVKIEGELTAQGQTMVVDITFENVGKAEVDTEEIEEMLDGASEMGGLPAIFG